MINTIKSDIAIIRERDPAARGILEIFLCYPGFQAIFLHRFTHKLWNLKLPLIPRLLSQINRTITGIEIHPGARIGRKVFIDHGMGVVIGETAEIGDNCLLYQGVTLGRTGKNHGKRHPTLKENVVVGDRMCLRQKHSVLSEREREREMPMSQTENVFVPETDIMFQTHKTSYNV